MHRDKPSLSDTSYIKQSDFACIECMDGYFLDLKTFLCMQKINLDPLCEETEANSNRCKKCKPEGFLLRVEGVCELSPNREKNCSKYSEMGICLECTNSTYPVTIVLDKFGDRFIDPERYSPGKKPFFIILRHNRPSQLEIRFYGNPNRNPNRNSNRKS